PAAEGADLPQPMGYEDDGDAVRALARNDIAQPVDIAPRETRGRLIEQQNAWFAIESACDFDLLLDRKIEVSRFIVEIDVGEADAGEVLGDACSGASALDKAQHVGGSVVEENIVEHRQIPDERHLLEGRLDTKPMGSAGRTDAHLGALKLDRGRVRLDQSR